MNRYRDWLEQAERDLEKAKLDRANAYWEWACFTAQQAAEKAAKALLMRGGAAAWGHGITPLLRALKPGEAPRDLIEKAQLLDAYYIPSRYPNGFPSGKPADYFNETKASEALDAAEAVLRFCRDRCA
jgi:HEPN domain-containing protein